MPQNDPESTENPTQSPKTTTTPSEKGTFQERVNQLTRRASEAERVTASTVAENAELRAQLGRLETKISQLATRPEPSASRDTPGTLSEANSGNLEAIVEKVTQSVLGAVQPVLDEVKQSKESTQLATKQQASFNQAATLHPELRNPDSDLFKTFAQLWEGNPELQRIEGSAAILATAARGLLSDAHAGEQVRKMAAAAETPRGARQLQGDSTDREVDEALDSLVKTGKKEGWNSDDMTDYLNLKLASSVRRK